MPALPLAPWFALGIPAGLFTAWVEKTFIGAQGAAFDLTVAQRLLLAGRVVWFCASKLIWQANLTLSYPRWKIDPAAWRQSGEGRSQVRPAGAGKRREKSCHPGSCFCVNRGRCPNG